MSKYCQVTGRVAQTGNNVSHAHNRTRRRFELNLQRKRFWMKDEGRFITLTVSARGLRTIDKLGIGAVVRRIRARGERV